MNGEASNEASLAIVGIAVPVAIRASTLGPAVAGAVNRLESCIRSSHCVVPANVIAVAAATLFRVLLTTASQSPVAVIPSRSRFATRGSSLSYDITNMALL